MLRGELHGYDGELRLELLREEGLPTLEYPVTVSDGRFAIRVTPAELLQIGDEELGGDAEDEDAEAGVRWQLMLLAGRRKDKLWLAEDAPVGALAGRRRSRSRCTARSPATARWSSARPSPC